MQILESESLPSISFHSYSTASGKTMRQCGVKEPIPVHFSRRYEAEDLEILKAEFMEAFHA